jgi:hypothetical protein
LISRRRIKRDASQRATSPKASNSRVQASIHQDRSPVIKPLISATAGVSGSAQEAFCTASGNRSKGKKTPPTQNKGSKNKVKKLFIAPIVVAVVVITIEIEANIKPTRKAAGIASTAIGEPTNPKAAATTSTAKLESTPRVPDQRISPITISSGPRGKKDCFINMVGFHPQIRAIGAVKAGVPHGVASNHPGGQEFRIAQPPKSCIVLYKRP